MIAQPTQVAVQAGFSDLLLVTTYDCTTQFAKLYDEDVAPFNQIRAYITTQKSPKGIADAIHCGESFCHGGPVAVCLGDNWFDPVDVRRVGDTVRTFQGGCHIWVKEVQDPRDYGVLAVDADGVPIEIVEKPEHPPSKLAVVGLYIFDSNIWDVLKLLQPSARGEYEVTDAIRWYLERKTVHCHHLHGHWYDLGRSVNNYLQTACLQGLLS